MYNIPVIQVRALVFHLINSYLSLQVSKKTYTNLKGECLCYTKGRCTPSLQS